MKTGKQTWRGTILALGILALGFTLALSTRIYYTARHPSAVEARFIEPAKVLAKFSPKDVPTILPGLPVRISVNETGYSGTVVRQEKREEFLISVEIAGPMPPADTACRVTVDASIPPEFLKNPETRE